MRRKSTIVGLVVLVMLVMTMVVAVVPGAAEGEIVSATLHIYSPWANGYGAMISVHRITAPWEEMAVTWENFGGAFDPAVVGSVPSGIGVLGELTVDVTGLVASWMSGGSANYGLLLEQDVPDFTQFSSREGTVPPVLEVCFTSDPASCEEMPAVADSWIREIAPTENHGHDAILYTVAGTGRQKQTLFQFDLPDLPSGEGCTPGYWKQEQHFDSWVGYAPADSFGTVFGVTPRVPGTTLLEALMATGGDEFALQRHATAALLNAVSSVDYAFSVPEIMAAVQYAYSSGDFEGVKDQFAFENELGCPLN